jgi:hypothetical protein
MQFESETPMQLREEGGQDEECFIMEGMKALKIFLLEQIAMVKKLLGKIENTEQGQNPKKLIMFEEKEHLQLEVSCWEVTLVHLQKFFKKDKCHCWI